MPCFASFSSDFESIAFLLSLRIGLDWSCIIHFISTKYAANRIHWVGLRTKSILYVGLTQTHTEARIFLLLLSIFKSHLALCRNKFGNKSWVLCCFELTFHIHPFHEMIFFYILFLYFDYLLDLSVWRRRLYYMFVSHSHMIYNIARQWWANVVLYFLSMAWWLMDASMSPSAGAVQQRRWKINEIGNTNTCQSHTTEIFISIIIHHFYGDANTAHMGERFSFFYSMCMCLCESSEYCQVKISNGAIVWLGAGPPVRATPGRRNGIEIVDTNRFSGWQK